jgi:hypothetical protein
MQPLPGKSNGRHDPAECPNPASNRRARAGAIFIKERRGRSQHLSHLGGLVPPVLPYET